MKDKDKDKDRLISSMHRSYERVFSQTNHQTRYKGIAKNQFALFMASLAFNFKRRVVLDKEYGL